MSITSHKLERFEGIKLPETIKPLFSVERINACLVSSLDQELHFTPHHFSRIMPAGLEFSIIFNYYKILLTWSTQYYKGEDYVILVNDRRPGIA